MAAESTAMQIGGSGSWRAAESCTLGGLRARPGDTEEMNRERAEAYLRLLAEEELRRAVARCWDGPAGSWPVDDAVRPASVAGALAGRVARRDGWMASGRGWSADRAVAGLYLAHYQALVRLAGMLVRDARVAEEVVQGSFVAMHGGWQQLGDAKAAEAYLRQEVVTRSHAVLRHGAGPAAARSSCGRAGPVSTWPGWPGSRRY
jgi:hypothetical protein